MDAVYANWALAVLTFGLVVVTLWYAYQTRRIADQTRDAAQSARESAEASKEVAESARESLAIEREQFRSLVRPELVLTPGDLVYEYRPGGLHSWTISNQGNGPACDIQSGVWADRGDGWIKLEVSAPFPRVLHPRSKVFPILIRPAPQDESATRFVAILHYTDLNHTQAEPRIYHSIHVVQLRSRSLDELHYCIPNTPVLEPYQTLCVACASATSRTPSQASA